MTLPRAGLFWPLKSGGLGPGSKDSPVAIANASSENFNRYASSVFGPYEVDAPS